MDSQEARVLLADAELIHPAATIQTALDEVAARIRTQLADSNPLLLCVMTGGVVFCGQLLPRLDFPLDFDYVQVGMPKKKKRTLSPDYPRDPQQVYGWLEEIGWQVTGKTGVRVFHDYLREKHKQRDCFDTLTELETRYCRQEPFVSLGRYIHVTAHKPQMQG